MWALVTLLYTVNCCNAVTVTLCCTQNVCTCCCTVIKFKDKFIFFLVCQFNHVLQLASYFVPLLYCVFVSFFGLTKLICDINLCSVLHVDFFFQSQAICAIKLWQDLSVFWAISTTTALNRSIKFSTNYAGELITKTPKFVFKNHKKANYCYWRAYHSSFTMK